MEPLKNKKIPEIYIGTSGWSYEHWKENFYPQGLKSNLWLNFYSKAFSTVEVNTTFYHLPLGTTVQKWNKQVSPEFKFSIKASRYITHQKRLKDCHESLALFFHSLEALKSKVDVILFQLPPTLRFDLERLSQFLVNLHDDYRYVFEFRHPSWFIDETYALLKKNKIALCITDLNGKLSPEVITSDITYIRLHGPHKAYQGSYGSRKLKTWKKKIENWSTTVSVYCYFDNDEKGYAIEDAKSLKNMMKV